MNSYYPTALIQKKPFVLKEDLASCGNLREKYIPNQLYSSLNDSNAFITLLRIDGGRYKSEATINLELTT